MVSVGKDPFPYDTPVDLYADSENYILCYAGHETVVEKLKHEKIKLEHSFTVQQAETVISLVQEGNGIGILSELVLNSTPNSLHRHLVHPPVDVEVGIVANDLNDMTPVAILFLSMIREECKAYQTKCSVLTPS